MPSDLTYDRIWIDEYIKRIQNQKEMVQDIYIHLNMAKSISNEINQSIYSDIINEILEFQDSLTITYNLLEKFEYSMHYDALRLEEETYEIVNI